MKAFAYHRATSLEDAAQAVAAPGARLIGGGTNLLDLMKLEIERPAMLVDISRLRQTPVEKTPDGGLKISALGPGVDVVAEPQVRALYPVLVSAMLSGGSAQIRNKATIGGNFLQRTRCGYFYDATKPCNKRAPGSGCAALAGFNRMNAVLGGGDACIAVHPSDMAVAMVALDASIETINARGARRSLPVADLYLLPGETPHIEHVLAPDEVIASVVLPPPPTGPQIYRKARDRASFAFAIVSVASVGAGKNARVALGGVAPKPWRARKTEAAIKAGASPSDAAHAELADARGRGGNDFKIALATRSIEAALNAAKE